MDSGRRALLAEIMDGLRHDVAGVVRLYLEFGAEISAIVRHDVRRLGGRHLTDDDIDGLTFDACLALSKLATSWTPDGGALPWVWGRHRIVNLVLDHLGPQADKLPREADLPPFDAAMGGPAVSDDGALAPVLAVLASGDERCALLRSALDQAMGQHEAEVLLRYRVQQQSGDPSPSDTVAGELGLQPPAVRQMASRARRRKLRRVIAGDPAYAGLDGIDLLDSARPSAGRSAA